MISFFLALERSMKLFWRWPFLLIAAILMTACTNSPKVEEANSVAADPPPNKNPFSMIRPDLVPNAYSALEEKLATWLNHYQFSLEDFTQVEHREKEEEPFYEYEIDPKVWENQGAIFPGDTNLSWWPAVHRYSPNKRYILDPHGYTYIDVEENGEVELGYEPDSKVDLYDLKEFRVLQVRFCGTPCYFEEGGFLNTETIVLAGFEEKEPYDNILKYPFLEVVHVQNGESWKFRSDQGMEPGSYDNQAYLRALMQPYLSK